jgi:hypothetical protein
MRVIGSRLAGPFRRAPVCTCVVSSVIGGVALGLARLQRWRPDPYVVPDRPDVTR